MFWDRFYALCVKSNTRPNPVAKQLDISSGVITKWKNGTIPNGETLMKLSDYFDCSIDYILGKSDKLNGNDLSIKEKELISRYRNKPEMQSAIDRLLGLDEFDTQPRIYTGQVAALGGDAREVELNADKLAKISELTDELQKNEE